MTLPAEVTFIGIDLGAGDRSTSVLMRDGEVIGTLENWQLRVVDLIAEHPPCQHFANWGPITGTGRMTRPGYRTFCQWLRAYQGHRRPSRGFARHLRRRKAAQRRSAA